MKLPDWLKKNYPFEKNNFFTLSHGNKLHYLDEGAGEPVIFLHGNPTWSFYYRDLILNLKDWFRCLAPDHIGCGLSDKPQKKYDYTLKNRIDDLIEWLEHLKIGRFHLVVHDWGGAIGMGVATHWPARIKSITILNSAAFLSSRIPIRIAICKMPIIGSFLNQQCNTFAKGATLMSTTKALPKEVKRGYLFPYPTPKSRIAIHNFVKDIPLKSHHRSYETLEKIENNLWVLENKPISIFWGKKDFCFNDSFLARWQEIFYKAKTTVFKDAGHYLLEDANPEAIQGIKRFLVRHNESNQV